MRAVLMAGGSGTRLRPLTCNLPKPMVPVLNRPIAEHIINLLKRHGIHEIIATLHYLPDVMRDYFQDGRDFGVTLNYAVEEEQPLGTAGCVKNIEEMLDDTFLVISGDSIADFNLQDAIAFHRAKKSKATLILTRVPNPLEFGVVITDQENRIQRFLEKPSASEIFSDTVNTGTYILEPEVLKYLPQDEECDFSKDLFPQLLEMEEPMYGYIADAYWCDVGHLEAYREAHYSALEKEVELQFPYREIDQGVWIGENTYIHPTAIVESPVLIGSNCRIGERAKILAGTIIGDNVTIGDDAELHRPIIWNGVIVGEESSLSACIIARGTRIDRRSQILEGAVIGSLCNIGEESQINIGVRVWPNKRIEPGAMLNINLIWGNIAHSNLFGQRGVTGLANIDITPEFAVKLGAAYGSTLKSGSSVVVSRDQRTVSRMVSRSLIAGLMSVGIDVQNLEAAAIPISRTMTPKLGVAGGIHVRLHPDRHDYMLIEFFDTNGINISKAKEKKIEGAYFKEDLRRVQAIDIGDMSYPAQVVDTYRKTFETQLNLEAIRNSDTKIVIDYVYSVSGAILPQLLAKFGCDAVVLNASLRQRAISNIERENLLSQLGHVVEALKANFGVQVSANGELLILVDESGIQIRGEELTALMVNTILTAHPRGTVVVPMNTSSAVEQIARRHDGKVIRTKVNPSALMETSQNTPNVVLGGSGDMGFIFPKLHPGFDAMFTIAKLIEMLTVQERSLTQVKSELPMVCHKSITLRCPSKTKGSLMRYLIETESPEKLELIDGVKIKENHTDNWVLILPDGGEPLVHVYANSDSREWVDEHLQVYRDKVQSFIIQQHSL
ncbi:mannose-1-phosphate guanyltransferase [Cyanobacterium aponinum UTEX 3222]|uniref:Mannose-1-phosphate guanylyltransferase, Phosphoglucosamine mutase n=3 Tax=Cyanobacterium aponinum TaxID=379064 RepID=K9Z1R3_CYAAP|nr:mannose-1-phosphate guanyltransferase [Cyanobacterium aponinum]WRL41070.1 mannose-1-phosphate guanyltransferase [Cyanobacterium aponinum UTEX 3222]AFZ53099.1 Mannose-1-phosphate guanylyltransferase, Phosphoglucosamine mutase [Cyanobacterium aponinum PCC 10605]MBD2395294.1 NTP transferase domain-containing protein [Cyanobacterium aponinum FACHB-4101]MTF40524.1 NTP transferase domain-containing protein [Cyanobacterium aponinum 0216]PHV61417.1 mannose-1-phosphate guanylyltransferase [Cyanobact